MSQWNIFLFHFKITHLAYIWGFPEGYATKKNNQVVTVNIIDNCTDLQQMEVALCLLLMYYITPFDNICSAMCIFLSMDSQI